MIATVTNQGKTRWMVVDDSFNADKLIEFLAALVKDTDKKVLLILDNLRVHYAKTAKAWLVGHRDKIEVFYLPSYSPELNPEERLNVDLKQAIGKKVPVRTNAKLRAATEQHMATWRIILNVSVVFFRTNGLSMPLNTSKGRINRLLRRIY